MDVTFIVLGIIFVGYDKFVIKKERSATTARTIQAHIGNSSHSDPIRAKSPDELNV